MSLLQRRPQFSLAGHGRSMVRAASTRTSSPVLPLAVVQTAQRRQVRQRAGLATLLERQIVATANEERERLSEESAALYQEILQAAEELPLVVAIARYRSSKETEWGYVSEIQNASMRLGRPYSPYEPERREISVIDMVNQATRNLASRLSAEAEEAHAAEREAYLNGDEGGSS